MHGSIRRVVEYTSNHVGKLIVRCLCPQLRLIQGTKQRTYIEFDPMGASREYTGDSAEYFSFWAYLAATAARCRKDDRAVANVRSRS